MHHSMYDALTHPLDIHKHEVIEYRIRTCKFYEVRIPNPIDHMDVIGKDYAHGTQIHHDEQSLIKTTNINICQTQRRENKSTISSEYSVFLNKYYMF